MSDRAKTTPSKATRDEERRDSKVTAGADAVEGPDPSEPMGPLDDVAQHEKEMTELGARQRGEGRLP
jgi:hypothetical protein